MLLSPPAVVCLFPTCKKNSLINTMYPLKKIYKKKKMKKERKKEGEEEEEKEEAIVKKMKQRY